MDMQGTLSVGRQAEAAAPALWEFRADVAQRLPRVATVVNAQQLEHLAALGLVQLQAVLSLILLDDNLRKDRGQGSR